MESFTVHSKEHTQFINIDHEVQQIITTSGVNNGVCHVFVPHTTAAVTINENADPSVIDDLRTALEKAVPWRGDYTHMEGNSAAHVKSSLVGCCQTVLVEDGKIVQGTWQSLFLCEFDGPRTRTVHVQVVPAA